MTASIERPDTAAGPAHTAADRRRAGLARYLWAGLRIGLGWIFLWAFLDKLFGWGFATESEAAVVNGGSPTEGFLSAATTGPFAGFYQELAGATWADVLFMAGLAGIGVALLAGVGMRIAAVAGALLLVMMWSAVLPPESNPFLDDHLIYAGLLITLAVVGAEDTLGLGHVWGRLPLVRRFGWLK